MYSIPFAQKFVIISDMGLKSQSQVGSVFDLDYLSSLHGIASLRGKVDPNKQGGFKLQVPRAGKQSAVDRTIEVGEEQGEDFDIFFQLFVVPNARFLRMFPV